MRTYSAALRGNRSPGDIGRPSRTLDEEAAFALRRAQYLQELRQAIAEVKRLSTVEVARDYSRNVLGYDAR